MAPARIIDSHVHLWPRTAANPTAHGWMQPDGPLTRQFSISDYVAANKSDPALQGFVYIETDRFLSGYDATDTDFRWAEQTFEELRFLRRIVEAEPAEGEDFTKEHGSLLRGAIIWAPVNHGLEVFQRYVEKAKDVAGKALWDRVKGFRFLFQGVHDEANFRELVLGEGMADIFRSLPNISGGMTFDIGVDTRSVGVWQLEVVTEAIRNLRAAGNIGEQPVFILNHMCKPNYTTNPTECAKDRDDFDRWKACLTELANHSKVFMKLSGAFSEMSQQEPTSPWPAVKVADTMQPWLGVLFSTFTPEQIMFGSDWPVCNVGGPGNEKSWSCWKEAVESILIRYGIEEPDRDKIWYGTADKTYAL